MTEKPKKMNYAIEPIRKILQSEATSDGWTEKKAEALNGTWIMLNENEYCIIEEDQTTRVFKDENTYGCACEGFVGADDVLKDVLCEHILALRDLPNPPQLSIESNEYRWLQEYLLSFGWYTENRYLYPSLDEEEAPKLDPVNEDKPLDTGVDDEQEPKMFKRKCHYCGLTEQGEDRDRVIANIAEHQKTCPKNPANKKTSEEQPTDPVVKESSTTEPKATSAKSATVVEPPEEEGKKVKPPSKKARSLFDWIEELVEFGVGQIFGDTGTAKTAFARELAEQAADEGKKVVYWDTEGNMTRSQRSAMTEHKNITYILDRDWDHIKNMLSTDLSKGSPKLGVCDLFILDSIGVPVLGIYGTLKQNQKGNALQAMQGLLYQLTKFAETNDTVVIVTNQPVSEMNKTELEKADRHPFGDKAMFFTKEILKIVVAERNEYMTKCQIIAWRSRSAGRGKLLCTVTVSDKGVEVTPTGSE